MAQGSPTTSSEVNNCRSIASLPHASLWRSANLQLVLRSIIVGLYFHSPFAITEQCSLPTISEVNNCGSIASLPHASSWRSAHLQLVLRSIIVGLYFHSPFAITEQCSPPKSSEVNNCGSIASLPKASSWRSAHLQLVLRSIIVGLYFTPHLPSRSSAHFRLLVRSIIGGP
jgi:hypothetical protein